MPLKPARIQIVMAATTGASPFHVPPGLPVRMDSVRTHRPALTNVLTVRLNVVPLVFSNARVILMVTHVRTGAQQNLAQKGSRAPTAFAQPAPARTNVEMVQPAAQVMAARYVVNLIRMNVSNGA